MWQRFTERARKVVFYAQEEAQRIGARYVSTEQILLGVVREPDSVAYRILEKLGVSPQKVAAETRAVIGEGEAAKVIDMTLTPRAKRVIDLAYDEARNLNNNYIGTEHLLLGLIREADGVAGRVLAKLGVELERARKAVIAMQDNVDAPASTYRSQRATERGFSADANIWNVLHARKQRMTADLLCMIFLNEATEAATSVVECGGMLAQVRQAIDREIQFVKTPEELAAGFLTASELLVLAQGQANEFGQELNGAHFLLAALIKGNTATASALGTEGITIESLSAWITAHP